MPGCVLRVGGNFSPGEFLREHPLPGVTRCEQGILLVVVSDHDDVVPGQVQDAMAFLERHEATLRALLSTAGVERAWLDFGLWQSGRFYDSASFPPELLSAVGAADISLTVSFYPDSADPTVA